MNMFIDVWSTPYAELVPWELLVFISLPLLVVVYTIVFGGLRLLHWWLNRGNSI